MSEPKPATSLSRREQTIAHAADLLREGGPGALTSVAVAARMGVTQSAVYRHVRSMDELSALAAELVVAELNQSLHDVMFDPSIDWEQLSDVSRLCHDLIDQVVRDQQLFEVVARWRFVDGPLGTGIRRVIDEGCELMAALLESRWRIEFGYEAPLDETRTAGGESPRHSDPRRWSWRCAPRVLAVARTARTRRRRGDHATPHRGWLGVVRDRHERARRVAVPADRSRAGHRPGLIVAVSDGRIGCGTCLHC